MKILGLKKVSKSDFEKIKDTIPAISRSWWLNSKSDEENDLMDYVDYGNSTNHNGIKPESNKLSVRPFLSIDAGNYIGKSIKFANKWWIINEESDTAICVGYVGECTGDKLDEYLTKWFDENKESPISDKYGELS